MAKKNDKKGVLVTFLKDVFPHVYGEVKEVTKEELDRVDAVAKARGFDGPAYVKEAQQLFDEVVDLRDRDDKLRAKVESDQVAAADVQAQAEADVPAVDAAKE